MHNASYAVLISMLLCGQPTPAVAQDIPDDSPIHEATESYVSAFNARDAKTLADHWSPQAVYISRTTGDRLTGRDAIAEDFAKLLSEENPPTLAAVTESVQFISPNVALERGTATVTRSDEPATTTKYSVVYINHDGKWLIDRVTEDVVVQEASNYDQLKGLEFLVGEWVDTDGSVAIRTSCRWTKNQNYISRTYSVEEQGEVTSSGLQIIGWDAQEEQIRSWLFDSSGTFVQGTWSDNNGSWMNKSVASLADGGRGSFTSVFRPVDENSYGWQKVDRIVDGQLMPSVDEVIVVREQD